MNAIPSFPTLAPDRLPTQPKKRPARLRIGRSSPNGVAAPDFNGLPVRLDGATGSGSPDRLDLAGGGAPRPQARGEADLRPARRVEAEGHSRPEHGLRPGESGLQAHQVGSARIAHPDRARSSYLPATAPCLFRIR
jgi:hypothetical protein